MTDCIYHPGVEAVGECANCGKPFCAQDVTQTAEGRYFCRVCASQICAAPGQGPGALAIISLALSAASFLFCLITAIPGMITGYIELANIKRGQSPPEGRGFAIAGAVIGTVVTALMSAFIALMIILVIAGVIK
jgi:hypothetical protein